MQNSKKMITNNKIRRIKKMMKLTLWPQMNLKRIKMQKVIIIFRMMIKTKKLKIKATIEPEY